MTVLWRFGPAPPNSKQAPAGGPVASAVLDFAGGAVTPSSNTLLGRYRLYRVIVEPVQGWEDIKPKASQYSDGNRGMREFLTQISEARDATTRVPPHRLDGYAQLRPQHTSGGNVVYASPGAAPTMLGVRVISDRSNNPF
jgi:hypothetical protein